MRGNSRRKRWIAGALALAAITPSCASRDLACPGFDACVTNAECPLVRCVCAGIPATAPPTCRPDGTCTTTADCAEVCGAAQQTCASPPTCQAFIPTECACGDGSKKFAAAWNCAAGALEATSIKDCDDTCDNPDPPATSTVGVGSSGSASTGSSF